MLTFSACQPDQPSAINKPATQPAAPAAAHLRPLVEQPLGETGFYLSLPPGFAVNSTNAADFLVYYFAPADTTVHADYSGGLYLGSQPQGEEADTLAGCHIRRADVVLLGHPATFSVRHCATGYTINGVFDTYSGRTWDGQGNAFGEARSAAGLRQLLAIFATLRHQPAAGGPALVPK